MHLINLQLFSKLSELEENLKSQSFDSFLLFFVLIFKKNIAMEEKIIYCENKSHDTYGKTALNIVLFFLDCPLLEA